MDEYGAVRFEQEETHSLGKASRKTTCVANLAAGDEQAHGFRTVLSVSDDPERCAVTHLGNCPAL